MTSKRDWRKSTKSNGNSFCVEAATAGPGMIAVRDSKNPAGGELAFPAAEWRAFTARIKDVPHLRQVQ